VARFYFDEMVSKRKAAPALRSLSHDVVTTEDVGQKGLPDYLQFLYAYREQRIFVTKNKKDLALLHGAWLSWGHPAHYGVLVIPDNVEDGELMRQIDALMRRSTPLSNKLHDYDPRRGWREVPVVKV
jgi:hypothetical protein